MILVLNRSYLPEGMNQRYQENAASLLSLNEMKKAIREHTPVELQIDRCDSRHNLHGTLGGLHAVIRREDAICEAVSGAGKEIAVLSLVGKPVCCEPLDIALDADGRTVVYLSRKRLQHTALQYLLDTLQENEILPAVITSMSPIGAFADIGCGVIALLPIRQISVSRIEHPRERFSPHQQIYALIQKIDREKKRFLLSHKELLGTWRENAACFREGETVTGVVRGVKPYGAFIELAPNLTGLTEPDDALRNGDRVSVLIKSIVQEKHKIKLHVVGKLPPSESNAPLHYRLCSGIAPAWHYFDDAPDTLSAAF